MKKQYIKPELQVTMIEVCKMIATSITSTSGADGLSSDVGETGGGGIISGNSKGYNDYDSDDSDNSETDVKGWGNGLW